jgi:short-subunit dehydrogenase
MKPKVLVTGASAGLGMHLSKKFEENGYEVFRHLGKNHFDISKIEEIESLIEAAKSSNVRILINNAAITCPGKTLQEYSQNEICNMVSVNLLAPILLTHGLSDQLTDVININSMVGLEIKSNRTIYSATKWGLRGFSQSFSAENKKINMLSVYPTNIRTTPDRQNAMDLDFVLEEIYRSFEKKQGELVLDGRK